MKVRIPSWGLLAKSAGLVLLAAVPVGVAWLFTEGGTAVSVYLGMTFMVVAVGRLPTADQCWIAVCAGLAAGVGALVAGNTPLLILAVVAACAVQGLFNRRSIGAAALLPSNLLLYASLSPGNPAGAAAATFLGAAIVVVLAHVTRTHFAAEPASGRAAALHAAELAVGCVGLILLINLLSLPRGTWAVLTLCLVLVPGTGRTRARVLHRALGTAAGAVVAVALAVVAPSALCVALAAVCAVFTVAYALLPDDFAYAVFLTPTVLLLFSGGRAHAAYRIALERVEMTALGAAVALLLTWVTATWIRRAGMEPVEPA
ncbi:FUSC family protein [Streptomyces sp. NPDC090306]|uniref:FUSC family protein n=1 Tax=unclassified Streptomyces TaxID=2593676 RepID=UPI0036EF525B